MTGIWYPHDVEVGQLYYRKLPSGVMPSEEFVRVKGIVDQPAVILESVFGAHQQTLVITSEAFAEYRRLEKVMPS